jgi:hypothetical protein
MLFRFSTGQQLDKLLKLNNLIFREPQKAPQNTPKFPEKSPIFPDIPRFHPASPQFFPLHSSPPADRTWSARPPKQRRTATRATNPA